ncbi:MAG: hypothetical protein EBQ92_00040, partial [Proteobacteria bacterium]|nr:hypothetical protein [Pseudomonadota bacterium]
MAELEAREEELNPLQKKRLYDLYQIEKKNLKDSSLRAKGLSEKIENLKVHVEPLIIKDLGESNSEGDDANRTSKEKIKFSTPELKRLYQQAHDAWNRDENEKALELIEDLIKSDLYQQKAESLDKKRFLNLYFRSAFDLGKLEKCQKAYDTLKGESECSKEAAQTGFLLALLKFAGGKASEGKELLLQQCDPDQSIANRVRRAYWLFRMSEENSSEKQKYYEELSSFPLPGYYMYLAESYRGADFTLPKKAEVSFENFSVSNRNEYRIREAEERIRFGLRKDAVKLLQM